MARIKQPILKGHRLIDGVWFPRNPNVEPELREQILKSWQSRAELYRFVDGYLLKFAKPMMLNCEETPGWALQRFGKTLLSAEFDVKDLGSGLHADLILVISGELCTLNIADATECDASNWISTNDYTFVDTYSFETSAIPPLVEEKAVPTVRDVFGDKIAAPSAERDKFLSRLAKTNEITADGGDSQSSIKTTGGMGTALQLILMPVLLPLWFVFGTSTQQGKSSNSVPARKNTNVAPQGWRKWLTRVAMMTQAARFIGWRQAAYLRRMMEKFDEGDLGEALRHAIPLGNETGSLGQAFGSPGPRKNLTIRAERTAASSIHFGNEMEQHLRQLYRQAFTRLDREGKVDEAAFVLAELLQVKQETLDYLVKHQRYQQAAELALAWDMPPDTIVRLCCLNNDWERAMLVARRDNAFASSVMLLEKQQPELANRLRLEWAQALILRGDWLTAVDVVWQLEGSRHLAAEWLQIAETAGGTLGARVLVQQALRLPDTLIRHREKILTIVEDAARFRDRWELATALLSFKERNAAVSELAIALLPRLVVDRIQGLNPLTSDQHSRLLKIASDSLLKTDISNFSPPKQLKELALADTSTSETWEGPEPGLHPICDAAGLSAKRFLLAHGEAGVSIVDENGAVLHRYAIPCHRIVLGDSEQIMLALAKRDEVWRVTRIDLVTHHAEDLGVISLEFFANRFDGIGWSVISGNRFLVLDCTRSVQDVLWHISDLPGKVTIFVQGKNFESFVTSNNQGNELWRYQFPPRRLIARNELNAQEDSGDVFLLSPTGQPISVHLHRISTDWQVTCKNGATVFTLDLNMNVELSDIRMQTSDTVLVIGLGYVQQFTWTLINLKKQSVITRINWPKAKSPSLIHEPDHWLFYDIDGRLMRIEHATSEIQKLVLR